MEYELTKNGTYRVKDFESEKRKCIAFINQNSCDILIMDSNDKKDVLAARTLLRKKKKAISSYRKTFTGMIVGTLEKQFMTLEKLFDDEDKKLCQRLEDYGAMLEEDDDEPSVYYRLDITTLRQEDVDKVQAYARMLNCKVKKEKVRKEEQEVEDDE